MTIKEIRIEKTLSVINGFNGVYKTRKQAMQDLIAAGYRVIEKNGKRRLQAPNGSFFAEADITKTAMDYAKKIGG